MRLQIKVKDGVIEDARFKTFGCGSAIASSSLATEWIKGRTLDEALAIKNTQIVEELSLPPEKIHCSVLAEDAIKAAIEDEDFDEAITIVFSSGLLPLIHPLIGFRRSLPGNVLVDLLFTDDGEILVLDNQDNNIRRYSAEDGSFLGLFASTAAVGMTSPKYMEFGPDGHVYVVGNGAGGTETATAICRDLALLDRHVRQPA